MADEELMRHFFRLLTVGPEAWNTWKKENPDVKLDFSGHKFEGINGALLMQANLGMSSIRGTNFSGAELTQTSFN